jgi:AcrR family transcriptional regulator
LTTERIVSAGVELADAEGLDGLQMRRLAATLTVAPMALYNHVDGKESLLDLMVEHVVGEIDRPRPEADWRRGLRDLALSTRRALRRHPWAIDVWPVRLPGPQRWSLMETVLELIAQANLPPHTADIAFHGFLNHVLGYVRMELAFKTPPSGTVTSSRAELPDLDPENFPRINQHLDYHTTPHPDHDPFLYVLELLLDDLAAGGPAPPTSRGTRASS